MKTNRTFLTVAIIIFPLLLSACKQATPQPTNTATSTTATPTANNIPTLIAITSTVPPPPHGNTHGTTRVVRQHLLPLG